VGKKLGEQPTIVLFVAAAQSFCDLLEAKPHSSKQQFLKRVLTGVLALYSAGLQLPDVEPDPGSNQNPETQERFRLKQLIRPNIILSLGGELPYRKVFEPFQDHEPVTATVSDDLEDIYCDVKEGLVAMEGSEGVTASIVWEWKFGLESHWGGHAVSAISALHCLFLST
jgi:hypothetical protein